MSMKRGKRSGSGGGTGGVPDCSCEFATAYPTLAAFLSEGTWEDGAPRETGTITLLWEEGLWKAALNNRDASQSAFVSGRTLGALFEAVEKGIYDDELEWRTKKPFKPGMRPRGG